jgi:hypothetical protein
MFKNKCAKIMAKIKKHKEDISIKDYCQVFIRA